MLNDVRYVSSHDSLATTQLDTDSARWSTVLRLNYRHLAIVDCGCWSYAQFLRSHYWMLRLSCRFAADLAPSAHGRFHI